MSYISRTQVRFAHVDAAGIVFYPRYFEIINAAVEDWFANALGVSFATLHIERRLGIPTVKLECNFLSPSSLGDELEIAIDVNRIGSSSCSVSYRLSHAGADRLVVSAVIVCMDLDAQKAVPWPEDLRAALASA